MRYHFLDGMRGIAAIAVVIFHFSLHGSTELLPSAYFAVDVFFCLSGFVIANAYALKIESGMTFTEFALRRFVRLYPMFAIGTLMGAVVVWLKIQNGEASFPAIGYVLSLILNLFYIPAFGSHVVTLGSSDITKAAFPFNDPAWTLFFELAVNFVFFIAWRIRLISTSSLIFISSFSLIILLALTVVGRGAEGWSTDKSQIVIGFIRTTYGFSAGVLISRFNANIRSARSIGHSGGLVLLSAFLVLASFRVPFAVLLLVSPILVFFGKNVSLGNIPSRFCSYLGQISYPLYCVHFPGLLALDYLGFHPAVIPFWGPVFACLLYVLVVALVLIPIDDYVRRMLTSVLTPATQQRELG
jgi:peptidoglycan/LPS O-acetylase OafA/YrhL